MSEPLVDLVIEDEGWGISLSDLSEVATRAATAALAEANLDCGVHSVCILACSDDRIAALNSAHRDKTGPTNVLSWPAFDLAPAAPGSLPLPPPTPPDAGRMALGDVAIALQTTSLEAENASIPLKNHVFHLILHGCLHLLGFDHETIEDAERMEAIEIRVLERFGVPNPY